jgi:phosphoribosylaminoimidazole carboxylase PurE protein
LEGKPRVGIVVGSPNDLPKVKEAADLLARLEIPYEVTVASAHRTPEKAVAFVKDAEARGIEVIIAGAGLAAHLPGVVAAHTTLPVIGVPLAAGSLGGLDALLSVVQMPPGVPVATVGIDGFRNAALLAAAILALKDEGLALRLKEYRQKMAENLEAEAERRLAEIRGEKP